MTIDDLKLVIGKSYNIDYVIKELEKAPEVQLGHIVIAMAHEHKYHVNKLQLEELSKGIKATIARGGKEYEKIGKKFVPLTDITILSIIDPYERYEKYNKVYAGIEGQILEGIKNSKTGKTLAPTEAIISYAREKIGVEDEEEFLNGMEIFFKRKGIDTGTAQGGKYIIFEMRGIPGARRVVTDEIDEAKREYEKYKIYEKFYADFFKQVESGMLAGKKDKIMAPIDAIMSEAKKEVINLGLEITDEKKFIRGIELYFKIRNIETKVSKDRVHLVFEMKD